MKEKNICKFVTASSLEKLETYRFIYETDKEVMSKENEVHSNRAILIKQGKGIIEINKDSHNFEPGYLIFVFSGETMKIVQKSDCEYMYIDFGGDRATALFNRFAISRVNRIFKGFDGLIPLWHDSLYRASEINLDLVSEGLLLYAFSRFSEDSEGKNSIVNKILLLTEENFTSSDISLSDLAKELSYNSKYLSHIFKEKMGISYSEHLRNLRIKYAVSLLDHGIDSVKNVAFLSGFTDPLYFSTVFKKTVGVSPKDYKKRFNKGEN